MNTDVPRVDPSHRSAVIPGRRGEWQTLHGLLEALQNGQGSAALVSGEAGIGKTALVEALADEARASNVTVLMATSYDMEVPTPYGLWRELFQSARRYRNLPAPPSSLTEQEGLERVSGTRELWDLAAGQILSIAGQHPVLLILEDLHWADQSSIELLRFLARHIASATVMIVVTYRDIELTPAYPLYHLLPQLVRECRPTRLVLRPLGREGVSAMVRQRHPSLDAGGVERLTAYLERYAEGNPLFIEEMLGMLKERRALRFSGGVWRLGDLPGFAVPPLIRQIIEDRLDHLSPAARRALEIASAIGIDVPLDIWRSIYAAQGEDDLDALEEVLRAAVFDETARSDILRFRHTLVRDAIYLSTNLLHRHQWHSQIGEALAGRPDADPDIVAHHFVQADDERAADWLIESAQRAGRSFALQAATTSYERALAILRRDPDRVSDQVGVLCALAEACRFTDTGQALTYVHEAVDLAGQIDDPGADVLSRWVQARVRGFDDQHALSDLIAAAAAFEELPESERERIAGSPLGYVVSRATLSQDLANYGMFVAALEQAENYLLLHAGPSSRAQLIEFGNAHFGMGIALAALGDPDRARSAFETSRSYFASSFNYQMVSNCCYWELNSVLQVYFADRPGERHRLQLEEVQANLHSEFVETRTGERKDSTSETLILDGEWDACWRSANLRLGIPASRVPSARKLAEIEWLRGNSARAREHIATALPDGPDEPPGRRFFLHRQELQWTAAEIALDDGDDELARRWIMAFERWMEWSGRTTGQAAAGLLWSRYHARRGDLEAAGRHARRSLELAGDPPQPLARLRALRTLGELSLAEERFEEAQRYLNTALAIAEACAAPHELALTQVALAEVMNRTGAQLSARALLDSARATARELDAVPLMEHIEAMSHDRRGVPASPQEPVLGLTPRQLEVLRLLTRGMTDAEIAEALFISPRTVHGHLNTIYSKLDVDSRTGAIARAYSEGIVSI